MTVGGGIRSLNDIAQVLRAGADKVAINTAAVNDRHLWRKRLNDMVLQPSRFTLTPNAKETVTGWFRLKTGVNLQISMLWTGPQKLLR